MFLMCMRLECTIIKQNKTKRSKVKTILFQSLRHKKRTQSSQSKGHVNHFLNLVPRSHSVTGNVRSGKVRQYTIFHWLLKKGCGNAIYAPIGLFCGALSKGLVFASSCAVLNKCQLCGGKFCFFPTPEKLYS